MPVIEKTAFGKCWYYNYSEYRFALYRYSDNLKSLYLANVEVSERYRGKGLGESDSRKSRTLHKEKESVRTVFEVRERHLDF